MDETIGAIASAGPPAGTTSDSYITTASASQCATPVGAPGAPSYRRRPRAYSPGHTIVGPSTPPLQTPAPSSHRWQFHPPPPPRCTQPTPCSFLQSTEKEEKSSTGYLCHATHGNTLRRRHHFLCSLRGV
ncbi:atherin-like [Salvelinus namaycush]|uniref:Atherin-like n=1 Tax=Salvelinus namaycush TaxID=8040 RepID=A0A8U0UDC6_SALNM|nr:atherin-like [Salvelinus namaycush]